MSEMPDISPALVNHIAVRLSKVPKSEFKTLDPARRRRYTAMARQILTAERRFLARAAGKTEAGAE